MIFLKKCFVTTSGRQEAGKPELLPIHHDIRYALRDAGIQEGLVTIALPEPGAGLLIAEPKEGLLEGIHFLSLSRSLSLPVQHGEFQIGAKEGVLVAEMEGASKRRAFVVQVMGDGEKQATEAQEEVF